MGESDDDDGDDDADADDGDQDDGDDDAEDGDDEDTSFTVEMLCFRLSLYAQIHTPSALQIHI